MKKDDDQFGLTFVVVTLLAIWGVGLLCAVNVVLRVLGG